MKVQLCQSSSAGIGRCTHGPDEGREQGGLTLSGRTGCREGWGGIMRPEACWKTAGKTAGPAQEFNDRGRQVGCRPLGQHPNHSWQRHKTQRLRGGSGKGLKLGREECLRGGGARRREVVHTALWNAWGDDKPAPGVHGFKGAGSGAGAMCMLGPCPG